jgi:hypothetical protein
MELRENRTELERLLADVWEYEDGGDKETHLPKWLFALTLAAAVVCTSSPSEIVAPVMTALSPGSEKLSVDSVSSENVAEDLDYRIARHADSIAAWRAFLEAHPNGPHARAARAKIDGPQPADDMAQETAPLATPTVMAEAEPPPPQPAEVSEQSAPSPAATQAPIDGAQSPAPPPVMVEEEAAPPQPKPVEVAEQPLPSLAATQAPVEAAPSPAGPAVMAEAESGPPLDRAAAALADAPLPPSRPREIASAKSVEPAHHSHWRAEHHQASQPNVLTILVAQLLHRHGQRSDIMNGQR